jgi:prepilin-type N-terminal cleavage/methylation domain-containing protein
MPDQKALTLMEIIVATVILAIVVAVLTGTFVLGKRYISHSRSRMSAAELAKFVLDPLAMEIREDTWNTAANNLSVQSLPRSYAQEAGGVSYTLSYNVSDLPNTALRKVVLNLTWSELAP